MNSSGKKRPFLTLLDQCQVRAGFLHLFGSHSLLVILLASCTIITLNWFGDGIWTLISLGSGMFLPPSSQERRLAAILGRLLLFPCLLVAWWLLIRKSFEAVANLMVHEQSGAPACKVLVLFLSHPRKDSQLVEDLLTPSGPDISALLQEQRFREGFGGPWRMPLEAIQYHLQRNTLERIMVIPSATVGTVAGKIDKGSFASFQDFKHLVEKLAPVVSVHRAGEADARWMSGVDYESARALRDCLADIFHFLLVTEGYREEEILIDITSGKKLCSSIGTLLSLQKGRQVQYVSTTDYTVKSYNIDYEEK